MKPNDNIGSYKSWSPVSFYCFVGKPTIKALYLAALEHRYSVGDEAKKKLLIYLAEALRKDTHESK